MWNASAPDARGGRSLADRRDHVGQPDPAPDAPVEPERHVGPGALAEAAQPDRAVERIRVAQAERTRRAMDLDVRRGRRRDVERGGEPADRPRREPVDGHGVRRRPGPRTSCRLAAPELITRSAPSAATGGRDRDDRAEKADECCDVVRPDIEQRATTGAVEELGVRMPALGAGVHDRRIRADRVADGAFVDERSRRLQAAAEERVRRPTDLDARCPRVGKDGGRISRVVANGFSE